MLDKLQSEPFIKSVYLLTILNTLGVHWSGQTLKWRRKLVRGSHIRILTPPLYNGNEWDYHFAFPSREYYLGFWAITHLYIVRKVIFPPKLS